MNEDVLANIGQFIYKSNDVYGDDSERAVWCSGSGERWRLSACRVEERARVGRQRSH